jgi:hypothetical protein
VDARGQWEERNFYLGIITAVIAAAGVYTGVAVVENYWPWQMTASTVSGPGPQGLPAGYIGTWTGKIAVPAIVRGLGPSADIEMTLSAGDGIGSDVGSIMVTGPWVGSQAIDPDCVAALHWQSGDGPITLTYDSGNSTGMCKVVSFFAHATVDLVSGGELDYTIDVSGYNESADLSR